MKTYTYLSAEGFSCDAYGQHAFGECGQNTDGGGLSNTGDLLVVPLALGGAILIASAILLVKRLHRQNR